MRYPIIVRKNKYGIIAFFPGDPATYGNIVCMSWNDGHNEASLEYYHSTKKATKEEEESFLKRYQSYSDSLPGEKEEFFLMHRLSYTLVKKAWKRY